MGAKLVLREKELRMGIDAFFTNCPNFEEDLPYHVRAPVGVEAFQILTATLETDM
jgi:hypothetical protein